MSAEGYERQDVHIARVAVWAAGLAVTIAFTFGLSMGIFKWFKARRGLPVVSAEPTVSPLFNPSAPRLQVDPAADLRAFRLEEDRKYSTYGWVDRRAGRVRIPVERAMDLLLRRGLPQTGRRK